MPTKKILTEQSVHASHLSLPVVRPEKHDLTSISNGELLCFFCIAIFTDSD